jgi:hypothetical protein
VNCIYVVYDLKLCPSKLKTLGLKSQYINGARYDHRDKQHGLSKDKPHTYHINILSFACFPEALKVDFHKHYISDKWTGDQRYQMDVLELRPEPIRVFIIDQICCFIKNCENTRSIVNDRLVSFVKLLGSFKSCFSFCYYNLR